MASFSLFQHSPDLKYAIQIAQSLAKEHQNAQYSPAHLLRGLLHDDIGLSSYLAAAGKDLHYLRDWADTRIKRYPKLAKTEPEPHADEAVAKLLEVADITRLKLSLDFITPVCVLAALCRPNVAFTEDQLKSFPLSEKEVLEMELQNAQASAAPTGSGKTAGAGKASASLKAIAKFCVSRTEAAKAGKIDPIIGREKEIQEISKILGRRTKPNVIIVGEPGVGKTALVEGFAQRIADKQVSGFLENAELLELDMGALIAGASYKGEIEDRLKAIINEIKQMDGKAILFIDEIHVLLDPKGSASGVANLLKPELARGELTVIGATTFEEYRKYIEKDDAFKRRFDVITVEEPHTEKAERMLQVLAPKYVEHHKIELEEEAIPEAVRLAQRYLKDRQLPDAAVDLIDRTMASVKMMVETTAREVGALRQELQAIAAVFPDKGEAPYLKELQWFDSQMRERISPILLGKIDTLQEAEKFSAAEELLDYLNQILDTIGSFEVRDKKSITAADVAAVVAVATGIPIGKIQADERAKLERMAGQLKGRVIGQDHAIESLSSAINISRAGLADKKRPVGSFFFLGPTGTGKTELAKSLADFLFNDERALIRFDMSEFTEKHTAQFLIGAPPGYVGYEEGGALVNAIRQQPYSIVLFDEIEKAHPEVFKTFLQILDDGKLSDKLGKEGDFSNAIILFTSNIGSEYIVEQFNSGGIPNQVQLTDAMSKHFKDEFLGRITEIIPFAPINPTTVVKIFDIQLKPLKKSLQEKKITLELTEAATHALAMKGYNPRFGARPLRRVVMNELQKPLAYKIIAGEVQEGDKVILDVKKDTEEIVWRVEKP